MKIILMKKVVKAIIYKNNQFLLQLRDNSKKISYPNHWSFFGGEVENNENDEEALLRELKEEIAWMPNKINYYTTFVDYSTNAEVKLYLIKFESNNTKLNLNEGQKMKWFRLEDIKTLIKTPSYMYELLNEINLNCFKII